MSKREAQSKIKRLQNIQEGLDALLSADENAPEKLHAIHMAYQTLDRLQSLMPEEIESEKLLALETFVQGGKASKSKATAEEIEFHKQGTAYFEKFQRWGDHLDLERAISSYQRAVNSTPHSKPRRHRLLSNFGGALLARFRQAGSLADLEAAISQIQTAVDSIPDGDPDKIGCLSNLGAALMMRFEHVGSLGDLDATISRVRRAIELTPSGHPNIPINSTILGNALEARFSRQGSLVDLEDAISHIQRAVDLTPDDHPNKPMYLNSIANALQRRFEQKGSLVDLKDAISQSRRAVNLTPDGHPLKADYMSNLGSALQRCFDRHGTLSDLEESILQQRMAVDLTPNGHLRKPMYFNNLGNALQMRFDRLGLLIDLEDAIVQKRTAVNTTLDSHPDKPSYLNNLAAALQMRFDRHGSLADLEDAILQQRKSINLIPDDHSNKPVYLNSLGNALGARYARIGSMIDLEDAILQTQKAVNLTPDLHHNKSMYLNNLGIALKMRYDRTGSLGDLEDAILQQQKAVKLAPDGHPRKPDYLVNLGSALGTRFDRVGSPRDWEDAIAQMRTGGDLIPDDHPTKLTYLNNLGVIAERKFDQDGALPDLEDSILQRQEVIRLTPHDYPDIVKTLNDLSRVLGTRFSHLGDPNDLEGALSAAKRAAELLTASSELRLQGALSWAYYCTLGSTSPLTAFECAIQLLPRVAWLGLAVDDQYYLLAKVGNAARAAVEAAIMEGEYVTAIEWAEQGRSIVWQNLLSLRTPLDGLRNQYPELAVRLQELSQHLEQHTGTGGVLDRAKSAGAASNRTALAMERDALIDEVRRKPGFGSFMRPKSLEELAPAARDGPVVFLNLGQYQCDALVFLADDHGSAHVVPVPLERITSQGAQQLSKKLADLLSSSGVRARDSRKHRIHGASGDKASVFKDILKTLWLDYVQPIIDGLAYQVNIESPPRLWWCTTGPLSFLPLHAAGLYDTREVGHKLSDYVISSYTPTLTALLEKSSFGSPEGIKILSVAISNTPGAPLPCTAEEVQNLQRLAANLPVVSLKNEEATQERVLRGLEKSTWVHLACHGEQVGGQPMESGLLLHDGKLKLSKIIEARLPNAEFAFLSACQTAVGDGGVPEESAHLAAGMLFAGYRGVVATMWSIQDDIAPRVAEDFYQHLFRHGQPKRTEAAYALHRALRSLQESGVSLTSWVPFIHIGR